MTNPFEARLLENLSNNTLTPGIFKRRGSDEEESDEETTPTGIRWSIEHMAVLKPAYFDENAMEAQWESDPHFEAKAHSAIENYWKNMHYAPSPDVMKRTSLHQKMAAKEDLIYRAKLAEQADRHNDMSKLMLQVAESSEKELLEEERNLFSYAFKNSVGVRRNSWRVLTAHELKLDEADPKKQVAKNYREEVEIELRELCNQVLEVVDKSLLPKCVTAVSKVFYSKMKGDYLRYLAEISSGDARQEVVEKSRAAYGEAFELAKKEMSPAHPIRLGLALNFAVFYYEIDNSPDKACHLAKQSFDDALPGVDTIDDGMKQDSSMILQLLRDNLNLWTVLDSDEDEEKTADGDAQGHETAEMD